MKRRKRTVTLLEGKFTAARVPNIYVYVNQLQMYLQEENCLNELHNSPYPPTLFKIFFFMQPFTIGMCHFIPKCSTITTVTELFSARGLCEALAIPASHMPACRSPDTEWDMGDNLFQCFILKQFVQNLVRKL